MLFSSLEFLYLFLPLTLVIYFAVPKFLRNGVLLAASIVFYAYGEIRLLWVMLLTVALNYGFGLAIGVAKSAVVKRALLIFAVSLNVGALVLFKYTDLLLETAGIKPLGIVLPLGISFYIFQAMSYVIDVWRGEVEAQRSPVTFGAYVMMFPQLVAGPIVRYRDVEQELKHRRISVADVAEGIGIFAVGLAKKVLLANKAGEMRQIFLSAGEGYVSVLGEWLALICYAFQIYYDFGGYSDMAVGLGRIFGFSFPRNFNYPYISKSITEFWRRWHITLSTWFREYVYISLGGNRCRKARMYFNLFITWLLTGLWHGAEWNFTLWGIYFFLVLVIEKTFLGKAVARLPKVFQHSYALFFILVGWLIFTSDDGLGVIRFGRLFGIGADSFSNGYVNYELLRHVVILCIMAIGATPVPRLLTEKIKLRTCAAWHIIKNILIPAGLVLSTASLAGSSYNPFLYFRF